MTFQIDDIWFKESIELQNSSVSSCSFEVWRNRAPVESDIKWLKIDERISTQKPLITHWDSEKKVSSLSTRWEKTENKSWYLSNHKVLKYLRKGNFSWWIFNLPKLAGTLSFSSIILNIASALTEANGKEIIQIYSNFIQLKYNFHQIQILSVYLTQHIDEKKKSIRMTLKLWRAGDGKKIVSRFSRCLLSYTLLSVKSI